MSRPAEQQSRAAYSSGIRGLVSGAVVGAIIGVMYAMIHNRR